MNATRNPVTLCSFTSWTRGLSPGATALLMTVRALTWVTERTVAAAIHGRPNRAEVPPRKTISSRSRWKPEPFTSIRSFLLTIRLQEVGENVRRRNVFKLNTANDTLPSFQQHWVFTSIVLPPCTVITEFSHVVICVSMKMRMKTSRAGKQQPNIIQMGKSPLVPRGLMTHFRLSGLVTEKPSGTSSFWTEGQKNEGSEATVLFSAAWKFVNPADMVKNLITHRFSVWRIFQIMDTQTKRDIFSLYNSTKAVYFTKIKNCKKSAKVCEGLY